MIELIYPQESVPLKGQVTAFSEMVPLCDENGYVTGRASREYCHEGSMSLHPVVHLHVIDRFERIFLQRRSLQKKLSPGLWDVAVGGHVGYGELFEEALYREAKEELAIQDFNPAMIDSYIYESNGERELVNVYATVGAFENLSPCNYEVMEGRFWTMSEIDAAIGTGILTPVFETEYKQYRTKLLNLL